MKELNERLQKRKSGPSASLSSTESQDTQQGATKVMMLSVSASSWLNIATKLPGKVTGFLHSMQDTTAKSKITQKFDRLHEKQR
jgi:hypothetical protein